MIAMPFSRHFGGLQQPNGWSSRNPVFLLFFVIPAKAGIQ